MAQTSARRSASPPTACSGARYASLPLMRPARVCSLALPTALAIPKSMTFTAPPSVIMMFCGETSR